MSEVLPCPFCNEAPIVHNHGAPSEEQVKSGIKAGKWAQIECASSKCAMRMVRTHRCGSLDEAVRIWNDR